MTFNAMLWCLGKHTIWLYCFLCRYKNKIYFGIIRESTKNRIWRPQLHDAIRLKYQQRCTANSSEIYIKFKCWCKRHLFVLRQNIPCFFQMQRDAPSAAGATSSSASSSTKYSSPNPPSDRNRPEIKSKLKYVLLLCSLTFFRILQFLMFMDSLFRW